MPRVRKYDAQLLEIGLLNRRPASWTFAGKPITGEEALYSVADNNVGPGYRWEFLVRVPRDRDGRIEVRPHVVPNLKVWAALERRSLTFNKANRRPHLHYRYCQIALADPAGERTKDVVHKDERHSLPHWFDLFSKQIRLKESVRRSDASDGRQLVVLVAPEDHATMIRLFFAMKVWILREAVKL